MTKFGERYELIRRIGSGGMGEVWLAHDEQLADRPVAIKIMHQHMLPNEGDVARFEREMRFAAMMDHPNIVTVYTTGTYDDAPFMVMEYLRGHDLEQALPGGDAEHIAGIGPGYLQLASRTPTGRACCTGTSSRATCSCAKAGRSRSPTSASPGRSAGRRSAPPGSSSARSPTCRPSGGAVTRRPSATTSGRSAASSTGSSPAGCRGCCPTPPTTRPRRRAATRSPTCATSPTRPPGSPAR